MSDTAPFDGTTAGWMTPDDHVVIVGGGFSGTLMAVNLIRYGGPRATLVERAPDRLGRGVAYGSAHPGQLLNVRASGMSAFPDDPGHFTRWAAERGHGAAGDFVARTTYGAYLRDTLASVRAAAPDRLAVIAGEAVAIDRRDGGRIAVDLADGRVLAADAVVLTLGNLPPHPPAGLDPAALSPGIYQDDPWRGDVAAGLAPGDGVLLVGTGLTAIDMALSLDAAGFEGTILGLSRRGLSPRAHVDGAPPAAGSGDPPDSPLSHLVAQVRRTAAAEGWRAAVDALRPITQRWWARADTAMRARFLRHLRPWWDVHRHRLAPPVAARIDAMVAAGRLRFVAGRILSVAPHADGACVTWRPCGDDAACETVVRRIVNCTGPQGDVLRSAEPLLRRLVADGRMRPDPLRLGIDIDADSRIVDAAGTPQPDLFCIGPMTRGSFWEIVAVPDIRRQCADLARRLSNAHWVGEGL
ncbi:FAD/NAD(P)-binding protein [Sphingomonas sp. 1P08PE]|uniref:FAD/NAD(P)-binding protein n=1 Tax=Sphingomonas sp. 1P08PE TaxID=554122 RepID=UPI0039A2C906